MGYKKQNGATLIVILILLLIITIIGTVAMRQSVTSLNIATNAQAQQLLFQNSDAAIMRVEDINSLLENLNGQGYWNRVKNSQTFGNAELVFCYKSNTANFYTLANTSMIIWPDGATGPSNSTFGVQGFCDASNIGNYTSGRSAVMTQIAIKLVKTSSTTSKTFENVQQGQELDSSEDKKRSAANVDQVAVYTTSFMPTLSNATTAQINTCLSSFMSSPPQTSEISGVSGADLLTAQDNAKLTVTTCLASLNVPFTSHVATYNLLETSN